MKKLIVLIIIAALVALVWKDINSYIDDMSKAQQEWRELGRAHRDRAVFGTYKGE